jgi:gas vesicle protein
MGQEPGEIRQEIEQTRSQMGDTVDALAYKTDVKSRVKESFADKKDRLRGQMQGASSRIGGATPDTGQVKDGAKQAVGIAEENPIGLALGGVAAGFLVGMMVPATKIEDERVGPIADQMKDKAMETGQEAIERGKDVAGQVTEQAVETAKEAGQEQAEELKSSVQGGDDQQDPQAAPQASRPFTP